MFLKIKHLPGFFILVLLSCRPDHVPKGQATLFERIPARETGIVFENTLTPDLDNNIFEYDYFYNGGGVAAADFNNDGLTDLFLSGNQVAGKLYLNAGGFKFRDATGAAGIKTDRLVYRRERRRRERGRLAGPLRQPRGPQPHAQPAIHQCGQAARRQRAVYRAGSGVRPRLPRLFTQAAFFDYDRDGDPDMYLLNHFHEKKNPTTPKTKYATVRRRATTGCTATTGPYLHGSGSGERHYQ
jgi:hypothetical protein